MPPLKRLICRFHGGDRDGTFDSSVDHFYGVEPRELMLQFYSPMQVGTLTGGTNQSAIHDLLRGVPFNHLTGRDQHYVVMDRKESDNTIEVDLAAAVIKTIEGKQFVHCRFNGREFLYRVGME